MDTGEEKIFKPLTLEDDEFKLNTEMISDFLSTIKLKESKSITKTRSVKTTVKGSDSTNMRTLMKVKEYRAIYLDILKQLQESKILPIDKKKRKKVLHGMRKTAKLRALKKYKSMQDKPDDDVDDKVSISGTGSSKRQEVGEEKEERVEVERSGSKESKEVGVKEDKTGEQQEKEGMKKNKQEKEKEDINKKGNGSKKGRGNGRNRNKSKNGKETVEKPASAPFILFIPNADTPKPGEGEVSVYPFQPQRELEVKKSDSMRKEKNEMPVKPSKESNPRPPAVNPKNQGLHLHLKPASSVKASSSTKE